MKSRNALYFLFLVVVVAGLVVFLIVGQDNKENAVAETPATAQPEQRRDDAGSQPEEKNPGEETRAQKRRKPRLPKNAINAKKRAEVLTLILAALQEKKHRKEEERSRESSQSKGLPAKYIREAVREIVPLLKECYDMELEVRGSVSGKIVLGFDLVADDEHGGLVEEASILESELSKEISDSFAECLRETVYALRLDAPEWGGRTTVRYPLYFSATGHDD